MTRIKNIEVEGFKGLEEFEMEVGCINVITGRNNTGKTSLLEAIDLIFNPSNIVKFGENVGDIINKKMEACEISCEYEQKQQMSLDDFQSEEPFRHERTIKISRPNKEEEVDYFTQVVLDIIDTGPGSDFYINRFWGERFTIGDEEDVKRVINKSIRESLRSIPKDYLYPQIKGNCIVISVDGEEYPYLHLGEFYSKISDDIVEIATERALDELEGLSDMDDEQSEEVNSDVLNRVFSDLLIPRFGQGRFVDEEPPSISGINFVNSVPMSQGEINPNEDNAAVIMSNIEDYLKENIVDNLEDFSFTDIVFMEEEKQQIPYGFMGDGFKAIVGVLWEVNKQESRGNVLMLEEPENNMHPGYVNDLVYRLTQISNKDNIQLFITTHNIDFIRGFLSDNMKANAEQFLREEFIIIQMNDRTAQKIPYDRAEEHMNTLHMDLRGP